jgi:hypothetical protein
MTIWMLATSVVLATLGSLGLVRRRTRRSACWVPTSSAARIDLRPQIAPAPQVWHRLAPRLDADAAADPGRCHVLRAQLRIVVLQRRVVINAVGRVGDHKVRRDATEHARNVGRHCAVAAEQAMAAEHP